MTDLVPGRTERPWRDHRQIVNVCECFDRWEQDGTCAGRLEPVQVRDGAGGRGWAR
jgi:hypothetical protein